MLKPNTEGGFVSKFELNDRDRAVMASAVKQEWFHILQRVMEEELRLLNVWQANADTDLEIVKRHHIVRGSGMFYSGVMDRLAEIVTLEAYVQSGVGGPDNPEVLPLPEEFQ